LALAAEGKEVGRARDDALWLVPAELDVDEHQAVSIRVGVNGYHLADGDGFGVPPVADSL